MAVNLINHEFISWYFKPLRRAEKQLKMPHGMDIRELVGLSNAEVSARNAAIDGEIAKLARLLSLLAGGLGLLALLTAVMTA